MFRRFIAASFLKLVTKITLAKLTPLKISLAGLGMVFLAMGLPVSAAADGTVRVKITGCIHPLTGCNDIELTDFGIFSAIVVYRTADRIEEGNPPAPGFSVNYPMATVIFEVNGQPEVTNTMSFVDFQDDCCIGSEVREDLFAVSDNQDPGGGPENWGNQTLSFFDGPIGGEFITNLQWDFGNRDLTAFDSFDPEREFELTPFGGEGVWNGGGSVSLLGPNGVRRTLGFEVFAVTVSFVADTEDGPLAINIHPGSDPNSINTCSGGTTPVTIFGTGTLDVATIDPTSLVLATATVKLVGKSAKILCSIEDIGKVDNTFFDDLDPAADGEPDLTCHFVTIELTDLVDTSTSADLTGNGCDSATPFPDCSGTPAGFFDFEGSDSVNVVKDCP